MVRFKKHIVAYGDTIQSIAQMHLGGMNYWVELAEFNNLKYPYVVDTIEEKMTNPDHLVTIGDTLLIQATNDQKSNLITDLKRTPEYNQEEIYALALGKDLDVTPELRGIGQPGYDSELLGLKANDKGRIATVGGLENLRQALFIRIMTPKGSYVGHPNFGSEVHLYLGRKNTEENASLLDLEIERTLRTDSRVSNVVFNEHVITGNSYKGSFTVFTMSLEEAFQFVISAEANGPVVLLNN